MLDQSKKLNDNALENVAGGQATLTPTGDGGVIMIDKNNKQATFTKEQWEKLKNYWAYTGNPVAYIRDVPIEDLNVVLSR